MPDPSVRRSRRSLYAVAVATALLLAGCGTAPQSVLSPEGPIARQLDNLFEPVFWIGTGVFVLVNGLILYIVVRFRAKGDDDAPRQIHGNARLELGWTIAPAVVLAVVGVLTVGTIFDINRRAEGAEILDVQVIGHQWWWEFRYPDLGIVTANELHIPAGTRVQLEMTAADVIHSFWPPALAGKLDVIPGDLNYMQLEADHPGRYPGQCAEFCGLSHSNMKLWVVAHEPADFDAWVRDMKRPAQAPVSELAQRGQELFIQKGCGGCHLIEGLEGADGVIGPNLTHLYSREWFAGAIFELNAANLRVWLRDPPAAKPMMPDDGMGMPDLGLSEEEITALIAYLETLE